MQSTYVSRQSASSVVERRESCQRRTDDRQTDHQFFTARRSALIVEWLLSPLLPFPQKLNFPRSQTFHLREFPRSGSRSGNCFSMTSFRTIVSQFLPLFNRPRRDSTWFATRMRPSNIFSKLDQTFPYTLVPSVQSVSKKSLSLSPLQTSTLVSCRDFRFLRRVADGCRERDKQRERQRERFLPTRCSRPNRFIRRQRASSPVIKTLTEAAAERSKAFRSRRPASSSKLSAKWFTRCEL